MAGYDPLSGKPVDNLRGPVVDFFTGSTRPPTGIPGGSAQRGVVTPLPVAPPIAPVVPAANVPRSPVVGGFDVGATGIPGINRITQPNAAPLFTNIADAAVASRGIFDKPLVSTESLNRTLGTSSVFNGVDPLAQARQAAAARGDFDAVDRSFRSDEEQVAHELNQAQGAIARGVTNSLRRGVPAAIFPNIVQSFAGLQQSNARATPGLDAGDLAAITNAQTGQGQLQVAQARLAQTQAADAATTERRAVNDIARISVNPETGLFDPARFDQNLLQYGPVYGLGAAPDAAPTALEVATAAEAKLRATGKYTEAQIQQALKQRAGQ